MACCRLARIVSSDLQHGGHDLEARRITEYGFIEGDDYLTEMRCSGKTGGRPKKRYFLTLDMAKELAMVERNEQGRMARQYFIECERRLREKSRPALSAPDMHNLRLLSWFDCDGMQQSKLLSNDQFLMSFDTLPGLLEDNATATNDQLLAIQMACANKLARRANLTQRRMIA